MGERINQRSNSPWLGLQRSVSQSQQLAVDPDEWEIWLGDLIGHTPRQAFRFQRLRALLPRPFWERALGG